MNKVFLFMMVSLDGYFEGANHDLTWHNVDAEFNDFADKQLDESGILVFGSQTFKMMSNFWPTDTAKGLAPETAKRMNALPKIVFSKKLKKTEWENTRLYSDDVEDVINNARHNTDKDIAVLGSSNLCVTLIEKGLLNELRIMINPVILGGGTPLFDGLSKSLELELINQRKFKSGNVLLTYRIISS